MTFNFFCQLVSGMTEVHRESNKIIYLECFHRDVKPENLMLMQDGRLKIGDFGLARSIIGTDITILKFYTAKGTPLYAAPNVIRG